MNIDEVKKSIEFAETWSDHNAGSVAVAKAILYLADIIKESHDLPVIQSGADGEENQDVESWINRTK